MSEKGVKVEDEELTKTLERMKRLQSSMEREKEAREDRDERKRVFTTLHVLPAVGKEGKDVDGGAE